MYVSFLGYFFSLNIQKLYQAEIGNERGHVRNAQIANCKLALLKSSVLLAFEADIRRCAIHGKYLSFYRKGGFARRSLSLPRRERIVYVTRTAVVAVQLLARRVINARLITRPSKDVSSLAAGGSTI